MAAYNKFNAFVQDEGRKVHNLNSDTLKLWLSNTAPSASNAVLADITQIGAGNGYSSGGSTIASTSFSQTAGTATLAGANTVFTASGGAIGPFRYAGWYNSTASGGPLGAWWDYGSSITLNDGETFTVAPASGNIFTQT